ncbi:type II toxin-antitoxin system RelE/ParE family toxin [Aquibium carbonis]|uniref:Type II toxin-antitoxin system RelE/ParE family toxin n=1 Tax=Aquibium carbonis TaxID=2495581 RepID=A0A3S0A6W2_9HYPH|nr:type II toxin-antitoxin system RelE/ParE family toxin [Aquibium carbonis]RST85214.1 type II toxin-antitoxin system RelE/ParE family toxin [Aquibium carbonis]
MKRIVARFFRQGSGREPVREWLLDLEPADRRIIGKDIATVEYGWPIGMPVCRALRDGVHEVRSTIRSGRVEARTYVLIDGEVLLLLHGAVGKDRQKDDIDLAVARANAHRRGKA